MKHRKIGTLTMIVGLVVAALWGAGPAFAEEKITLALQRAKGVEQGSGAATIANGTITIRVKELKPNSVYTTWYVNMEPKHEMAGVGSSPYMFKTDRKGAATFKAKLDQHPVGKWQMLVIIRHPTGDPMDMQHKEDALWASLAKAEGGAAVNPCAAGR